MSEHLIDITTDGHVHTCLCHHATGEMEEYVVAAVAAKLKKIIFLEHYEAGVDYFESTWLTEDDFIRYHLEGKRLDEKYRDKIAIGLGVEVGINPECFPQTNDFLRKFPWERIGLSYHYLRWGDISVNMVSRKPENIELMTKIGTDKVATAYFSGLKKALAVIPADVVCHLDAVLRHCPAFSFTEEHFQLMREILCLMREKEIALEVNTSGYALRNEPFPAKRLLQEALKIGVRLRAGSDAHRPADVGRYFDRLHTLVGDCEKSIRLE